MAPCHALGGYAKFRELRLDDEWLPVWLQRANYTTLYTGAPGAGWHASRASRVAAAPRALQATPWHLASRQHEVSSALCPTACIAALHPLPSSLLHLRAVHSLLFESGKFIVDYTIRNRSPHPAGFHAFDALVHPFTFEYYCPAFSRDGGEPRMYPGASCPRPGLASAALPGRRRAW